MATDKQPAFPHPALEVGVPQYPTPNVPDFYKKDGHIILVDKISADKGSYNPAPLDGSVTYSGKDANKFPAPLYLVRETPTPDGMFVYRTWANDRTYASQDPWNYGVKYSENDPTFSIYTRTYITPRDQYAPIAKGQVDPVFGGTAIVVSQEMQELPEDHPLRSRHVQVVVQYESIPGPIVTGKQINQRGDIETVEVQTVVAGTTPDADSLLTTSTSVDPVDAIKSKRKVATVTSYTTLKSKQLKGGVMSLTTTTDNVVAPSTEPDPISATVLESVVEQTSKTKARKRTTSLDASVTLSGSQKKEGLLGEVTTLESIVAANTLPDALSTSVVSSQVEPIDSFKSKKTTITSIGPSSLSGGESKGGLLGNTTIAESIVASGTSPDPVSIKVLESRITPMDSGKSKKTTISSDGPTSLAGAKTNRRGDIETSTESIVTYGTASSTDSYLLQSSQVEPMDLSKSKKVDVVVDKYSTLTANSFDLRAPSGGAEILVTNQIVDPSSYTTPTPSFGTIGYKETPVSKTKTEVTIESINSFPQISSTEIDPVSNVTKISSYKQVVDPSTEASANNGVVTEVTGLDQFHSELTQKDYSSLVGVTWTEYENESYSPPGLLYLFNAFWASNWSLNNIVTYVRPQSKTVTATVKYTITSSATTQLCFNPITRTLITDLGTFTNVLHNAENYIAGGVIVNAFSGGIFHKGFYSNPNSMALPSIITLRFSSTRIPKMGGLYLEKVVTIPFASLYDSDFN